MKTILSFICLLTAITHAIAGGKTSYNINGTYIEGCTCAAICGCDMTGIEKHCQGVGVLEFRSGSFEGTDLAGGKIAIGLAPEKWVHAYVDGSTAAQRKALASFARKAFAPFGKIEAVEESPIAISGRGGNYTVTVAGGKTMRLKTKPVLGGDKKTPVVHANVGNPMVKSYLQAKTVAGSFHGGGHVFTFKDTNSFYNDRVKSSGAL